MISSQRKSWMITAAATAMLLSACSGGGGGGSNTPKVVASTAPQTNAVQAKSADAFVDSIGVNTHVGFATYSNPAQSLSAVTSLGVRHVRDSAYNAVEGEGSLCAVEAASGLRFDYVTAITTTADDISYWSSCVGTTAIESWEGPDEYDNNHPASDTNWPQTLRTQQSALYSSVKSTPALTNEQVLAPSLISLADFQSLGDVSAVADGSNLHLGFAGFYPGTSGYGANGYGSIAYNIMLGQIDAANKPVYATETGYNTDAHVNSIDLATDAKYTPRELLEEFNSGIVRSYIYELADQPAALEGQAHRGLLDSALNPKPAYTVLQSLLSLLSEPGANFSPSSLSLAFDTTDSTFHHTLLEKSNGTFYLLFWLERSSYDTNAQTVTAVPTKSVPLILSKVPTSMKLYTYDSTNALSFVAVAPAAKMNLQATDSVSVLQITP